MVSLPSLNLLILWLLTNAVIQIGSPTLPKPSPKNLTMFLPLSLQQYKLEPVFLM